MTDHQRRLKMLAMHNNGNLHNYRVLYEALVQYGLIKDNKSIFQLLHTCLDEIRVLLEIFKQDG